MGTFSEKDPIIGKIIDSDVMKRLKKVDQSGLIVYYKNIKFPNFLDMSIVSEFMFY